MARKCAEEVGRENSLKGQKEVKVFVFHMSAHVGNNNQ
jgi:hypothetical protein